MIKQKILVTGARGFIGNAVTQSLLQSGHKVIASGRNVPETPISVLSSFSDNLTWQSVGSISGETLWERSLQGITTVIHCAARAHVMRELESDPAFVYRKVNVEGSVQLAKQAVLAGVKRFVFISSIGVNGKTSKFPFTEADAPNPHDAYSISKFEAEKALMDIARQSDMEVVIIRAPLVYGPKVPGNFSSLVRMVQLGIPLPLGAVHNRRSLVALDNLVSLVQLCSDVSKSPSAANQLFLAADGEDVSTTDLLRKVAQAACCPSRLVPVPSSFLEVAATLFGLQTLAFRLLRNLQVDATKARNHLGWSPVVTLDDQLVAMFR
jgi:nucleoside-diphosphate-sugar epimerase